MHYKFNKLAGYAIFLSLIFFITSCKTTQSTVEQSQPVDISQYQGGMWTPSELAGKNEQEIKALGGNLSAEDIYSTDKPSLKDAIVQFGGGCTAEIISPNGLILTNHHCGYGRIQSHSTVEHNYLEDGFWAKSFAEELPNKGLTATMVVSIEDVTDQVFNGSTGLEGEDLEKVIADNIKALEENTALETYQVIEITPFSNGNQYYKIISNVYKDVRLVGAPPSSIGKFGADTDNWMWPRHSGDFSLFRIYADANNLPAEYSEDNKPYKPKHFLPVSTTGVKEGDFTLVFGYPGRTDEYLPSVAIDQIVNKLNPDKIAIREAALAVMDKYMRNDPEIKIQYASKYAGIANYWKKWIGESQGLEQSNAVAKKQALETEFQNKVNQQNLTSYKTLLSDFNQLYAEYGDKLQARDYFTESLRNIDLMYLSYQLYQLDGLAEKQGVEAFDQAKAGFVERISSYFKNYNADVDRDVFAKVMYLNDQKYQTNNLTQEAWQNKANTLFSQSALTGYETLKKMLEQDGEAAINSLRNDVAYAFAKERIETFFNQTNPEYYAVKDQIDAVQKVYTKALIELFPDMRYFPDANSTLRVTYGQVKGYEPRDGMAYTPVSYLEGVVEKYVPGDYEFDVSDKLLDLFYKKDFGAYADTNGKLAVNFLGTNHTTGGNSGSPVLDADGNLIGLNFDRVWEGTMSDYNYDADICRNVMVDARYILFIIDKYAGAQNIIDELQLVD